jgi:hypothetical protein
MQRFSLCRPSGAHRTLPITQRFRAGLTQIAPPALESNCAASEHDFQVGA